MEALQLAQMLADLNDLQASQDQNASKALVGASKNLDRKGNPQTQPPPRSSGAPPGSPPLGGRRATDKLGRRIFTPPLSRNNSGLSATPSSVPGTPREDGPDTDIDRASTLLSLYEIRAKLREQDNSSLMKAREKIAALAAKQQAQAAGEQRTARTSKGNPGRIPYPK